MMQEIESERRAENIPSVMLKDKVKWWGAISGCIFLGVSTYVSVRHVFWDGNTARILQRVALGAAGLTLVFGLLALPRWQSFFALAVVVYAMYWLTHVVIAVP
jgi:hypothetical protein